MQGQLYVFYTCASEQVWNVVEALRGALPFKSRPLVVRGCRNITDAAGTLLPLLHSAALSVYLCYTY